MSEDNEESAPNKGYEVAVDSNNIVTVSAPSAEGTTAIEVSR